MPDAQRRLEGVGRNAGLARNSSNDGHPSLAFRGSSDDDIASFSHPIARSFSHVGAGQAPTFAIPSFASQIVAIRQGRAAATLQTGDMTPILDFLHVADVMDAYAALLEKGEAGATYNVASGVGRSLQSLLDRLPDLSGVRARVEVDPARLRPVEIPVLVGDSSRLRALGWSPSRTVEQALCEVLDEFGARNRASKSPRA